jgi:hypothetical protein
LSGKITEAGVVKAVQMNFITPEQYKEIIGEPYTGEPYTV